MSKQKPYYLRQPWDILFRENKLERVSPWNVNLVLLLTSLLKEMEEEGIDFRLAGTAIQSSVLIYPPVNRACPADRAVFGLCRLDTGLKRRDLRPRPLLLLHSTVLPQQRGDCALP